MIIVNGAVIAGLLAAITIITLAARLFLRRLSEVTRPPPAAPGPDTVTEAPAIICHACEQGRAGDCVCEVPCGEPFCERARPLPDMLPAPQPGLRAGWPVVTDDTVPVLPGAGAYDPETAGELARIQFAAASGWRQQTLAALDPEALAAEALAAEAAPLPPALAAAGECDCVLGSDLEADAGSIFDCPVHGDDIAARDGASIVASVQAMRAHPEPPVIWTGDLDLLAKFRAALAERDLLPPDPQPDPGPQPGDDDPDAWVYERPGAAADLEVAELEAHAIDYAQITGQPGLHDPEWPPWRPWYLLESGAEMLCAA